MRIVRIVSIVVVVVVLAGAALLYAAGQGWFGETERAGSPQASRVPAAVLEARREAQREAARAAGAPAEKQILFGDLHVHSTFSTDAFLISLPALGGEGAHPVADACDFARYCSALDFWSINDHSEGLPPRAWRETIEAIRQCNARAADPSNPDVVAFLGWEWTQVGDIPANHYGHKNVILRRTEPDRVPARPIASVGFSRHVMSTTGVIERGLIALLGGDARYHAMARYLAERVSVPDCPSDQPSPELPPDCFEGVATPAELFRKLDEWGVEALVIPHGTTWGFYTPPGSTWDKQLVGAQHDENRQRLIEVYSGHGNSEEYREWRAVRFRPDGSVECPEPTSDYLPSCWRAGEIIAERCRKAGLAEEECDRRAAEARRYYAEAGVQGHLTVAGENPEDWLDSGQCRDCFLPAFNYRPGGSVQYIMALRNFDDPRNPRRFDFGFIASSDIHSARPGTGYKEFARLAMTEATGPVRPDALGPFGPPREEPVAEARPVRRDRLPANPLQIVEVERQASFFLTGGLVAVHATGRNRDAIWEALQRREVYGTSGPRILLWFDIVNAPGGEHPMGSTVEMKGAPEFRVRAVGSFEQKPGCPEHAVRALGKERIDKLCRGECYYPGERRRKITRIEVVRIRPQIQSGEPVGQLIEDPWRIFPCAPDPAGCTVTFSDPDFPSAGRDSLYYVRAIEEPSQAVNAGNLRCEYDAEGNCVKVNPCWGDWRTPFDDDCLGEVEERAWSSPIFVRSAAPPRG